MILIEYTHVYIIVMSNSIEIITIQVSVITYCLMDFVKLVIQ